MKSAKQGIFPREARTHDWALTGAAVGSFTSYKCTKCGTTLPVPIGGKRLCGCGTWINGQRYEVLKSGTGFVERGIASWYGPDFHGRLTSNREVYDMYQMTAAHKLLPLPTWVEVTNLENGRKAVLKVNDRGPFKDNRVIDLSYAAALKLEVIKKGTAFVEVRGLERPDGVETNAASASAPSALMFLQVGAFGERDNAERQKVLLTAAIHQPIRVFEDRTGGRVLYKVQVGPLRDVDQADQVISLLDAAGVVEHHFVNQ